MKRITTLLALACLTAFTARAQLVADGATVTLNGGTTNIVGDLFVGTNGSFTTLTISNTATVTNSGYGYIGYQGSARTNLVVVTDTNSVWSVGSGLEVGMFGRFNRLIVTNGGRVNCSGSDVGNTSSSFGNTATIVGPGSIWSATNITVAIGRDGSTNGLVVVDGGTALFSASVIGANNNAHDNYAVIAGTGAQWLNQFSLVVGSSGSTSVCS